jgi:hypothetical protein
MVNVCPTKQVNFKLYLISFRYDNKWQCLVNSLTSEFSTSTG